MSNAIQKNAPKKAQIKAYEKQLKDVMTTHVRGISAEESVQRAAEAMNELRVGSLPVFRDGQPIGIVTDRDITIRAVARGCDCSQTPVEQVMSQNLISLPEKTPVKAAVREMKERQIRRLLVTGEENAVVGIVSLGDIVAKSNEHAMSAELIEKMSVPAEPVR